MADANSILTRPVKNHGNSLGITIPSSYAEVYNIELGDEIEIDMSKVKVIKQDGEKEKGE